jgi:hypothetical protein
MKYQLYVVKKFFDPIEIEAENPNEAEEKAYEWMEANNTNGKYDSDDTYIHFEGELKEQS